MDSFSISEAISFGWKTFKSKWAFLFGVLLFVTIVSGAPDLISIIIRGDNEGVIMLTRLLSLVLGTIVNIGLISVVINLVDGKSVRFADLFSKPRLFFSFLFAQIIEGIIVVVGILLFIIPGIIFALRLQFVTYFVVDKGMGPLDALRASWNATRGSTLKLLLFSLTSIGLALVGMLLFGVGLLLVIPTITIATAYIYRKLSMRAV